MKKIKAFCAVFSALLLYSFFSLSTVTLGAECLRTFEIKQFTGDTDISAAAVIEEDATAYLGSNTALKYTPVSTNNSASDASVSADEAEECAPVLADGTVVSSRIWNLLFGEGGGKRPETLLVGGDVFGIKIRQRAVTVTDSKGIPALRPGDVILSINGRTVSSVSEAREAIAGSGGESVTIKALHGKEEITLEVRPRLDGGEYKLGLSLRDGTVGIGTMTFIDPTSGVFGGLGHGICDSDTGEVVDMISGEVVGVLLGGVHKGECGKPGELSGILTDKELGSISQNNECGVFGLLNELPTGGELYPIGTRGEVHEGEATIISTIKNGKRAEYKIEIHDIDKSSTGSKSFKIRVTDKALIGLTGGIVRGMSGSPIIQDGKLVGAVTHVMVADPTEGYGIFIENMLSAAQMPMAKAS